MVCIWPCISLIRYHMQINVLSLVNLPLLWWSETQFFWSKLIAEKISCFKMTNLRALNSLTIYYNIFKIRLLIHVAPCRNSRMQMDPSNNNHFSLEEARNYNPRTEKRKKVPVCEMLDSSGSLSFAMHPTFFWKLKIKAYQSISIN